MPRIDPAEFLALPLRSFRVVNGFPLHDVWRVDLDGDGSFDLPHLIDRIAPGRAGSVPWTVRSLFALRRALGTVLRLDRTTARGSGHDPTEDVPPDLAVESLVPSGTPLGPFRTLYLRPDEAAYAAVNGTVNARLVIAVVPSAEGRRLYWATYVRPVGRITSWYMRLIDPFRRSVVYPGLEAWLKDAWRNERRGDS